MNAIKFFPHVVKTGINKGKVFAYHSVPQNKITARSFNVLKSFG